MNNAKDTTSGIVTKLQVDIEGNGNPYDVELSDIVKRNHVLRFSGNGQLVYAEEVPVFGKMQSANVRNGKQDVIFIAHGGSANIIQGAKIFGFNGTQTSCLINISKELGLTHPQSGHFEIQGNKIVFSYTLNKSVVRKILHGMLVQISILFKNSFCQKNKPWL